MKKFAIFATKLPMIPRMKKYRAKPIGRPVVASTTRIFSNCLAGVWPLPAVIAAQISQPMKSVAISNNESRREAPIRDPTLAICTPGGNPPCC